MTVTFYGTRHLMTEYSVESKIRPTLSSSDLPTRVFIKLCEVKTGLCNCCFAGRVRVRGCRSDSRAAPACLGNFLIRPLMPWAWLENVITSISWKPVEILKVTHRRSIKHYII